jgi:hypothetical protein
VRIGARGLVCTMLERMGCNAAKHQTEVVHADRAT